MDVLNSPKTVTRYVVAHDTRVHEATGFPLMLHRSIFRTFRVFRRVDGPKLAVLFGEEEQTGAVGHVVVPKNEEAVGELSGRFDSDKDVYAAFVCDGHVGLICCD